jgi:hypothetical protein
MYIGYDVVGTYHIRCRMSSREHTMAYVLYDIVYFCYFAQNLRHRRCTYDIVCMTYDVVCLIMRSVPAAETTRRPPLLVRVNKFCMRSSVKPSRSGGSVTCMTSYVRKCKQEWTMMGL